jgi:hypothetical protein
MIGAACDRIIASIYGEVAASSAVSVLDVGPDPLLPAPVQAGPGTADRPRPSIVTRYVQGVKTHWSTSMRFPNPLQAVVLAVGFGLCFLLGGTDRLTSPTFDVIRNSGGAVVWGLAYIVVATALFGAWRIWRHGLFWAYVAAASGYLSFAVATFRPAWEQPTVNYLACFLAAWLAWVHTSAAVRVSGEWTIERWWRQRRARKRRR